MSASSTASSSTSVYTTPAFWERLWRTGGIQSIFCFITAYFMYGHQPQVGAAATASSTAVGALFLLLITVVAALAFSIAGSGNPTFTSGLNDLAWAGVVLTSFPRAMLIMSGAFGLWRARLISNALFAAGVAAVVLVLLGGTTWLRNGFWSPYGAYSRFVSPIIGVVWVVVVSRVFLTRSPATRAGW